MFRFIGRHWIVYIILAVFAIVLGFGAASILGVKWSTPADVRAAHIEAERNNSKSSDTLANEIAQGEKDLQQGADPQDITDNGSSTDSGSSQDAAQSSQGTGSSQSSE